jgi:hypothetical protein
MRTAYELPFSVTHPTRAFFSSGQDLAVVVRLRDDVPPGGEGRIAEAVERFVDLAASGALAGQAIEPWRSGAIGGPGKATRPNEISFPLEQCRLDDASLIVLCDLLLHEQNAPLVKSVAVQMAGVSNQPLVCDPTSFSTYPETFGQPPFPLDDEEPETGAYSFAVTFASPLDDPSRDALRGALDSWTAAVLAGGFAQAPIPPADNYIEPDNPFVEYDTTVEWTVFKLHAHTAAVDALVNALIAFHRRQRPITALTIS